MTTVLLVTTVLKELQPQFIALEEVLFYVQQALNLKVVNLQHAQTVIIYLDPHVNTVIEDMSVRLVVQSVIQQTEQWDIFVQLAITVIQDLV